MQQAIMQSNDKVPKRGGQSGEAPAYQYHNYLQLQTHVTASSYNEEQPFTTVYWLRNSQNLDTECLQIFYRLLTPLLDSI